jgi:hypothetical protein
MIRMKLMIAAIMGSVLGYFAIKLFIVNVNVLQYLCIEGIVTVFHLIYNKLRDNLISTVN